MKKTQLNDEQSAPCVNEMSATSKKKKATRKTGRKKIKRLFEDTRVGYFLKNEAPIEYGLIMDVTGKIATPSADLIEAIGYASLNPLFKKPKFRRALIEYRKTGLYPGTPKTNCRDPETYFRRLRKQNMKHALENLNEKV